MIHLIYVADPMCSWCYGFGPELNAVLDALPEAQLAIVLGGLRAGNAEVMDEGKKATILTHWTHVEQASGLPFSSSVMARPGFVYDTEPACRAVVAARILGRDLPSRSTLAVFHAIQRAFYAQGRDVTDLQVLADIGAAALTGAGQPTGSAGFLDLLNADATIAQTRQDFSQVQRWGIRGFPALLIEHGAGLQLICSGYAKAAVLMERIGAITQLRQQ